MAKSILEDVKQHLGVDPSYTEFDDELRNMINVAMAETAQVGGSITHPHNNTGSLGSEPKASLCMAYIYCRVKLMFDPPQNGYYTTHLETRAKELLWRISVQADGN